MRTFRSNPIQLMDACHGCPEQECLAVLIFSKDRPCQLLCCLQSLLRHLLHVALDVTVLYKASGPAFVDSYSVVESLFRRSLYPSHGHSEVHWMEETDEQSLGQLMDLTMSRVRAKTATLLLTVDDALWFADFNAAAAVRLLQSDDRIYAVHAKLCPRIEYAHPNNKFMRLPPLRTGNFGDDSNLLIFEREKGEYDWNYPWELSASFYRLDSVEEAVKSIRAEFGSCSVDHPNHLEGYGVRLLKQQKLASANDRLYCACPADPVVAVVTINRVQNLFENPVYGDPTAEISEISVEDLDKVLRLALHQSVAFSSDGEAAVALAEKVDGNATWWKSYLEGVEDMKLQSWTQSLDFSKWPPDIFKEVSRIYASTYWDSVHVPLPRMERLQLGDLDPIVSWLMPVKDTPSSWLDLALDSIEHQEGMDPKSWELIVVDDGSTVLETKATLEEWAQKAQIQVIKGSAGGIAAALNEGWKRCRGRYICRLDGDDCAHPERLKKQIGFLERHPSIAVLGAGFCTFQDGDPRSLPKASLKRYRMPCHPILARWRMIFSCSLAHPTVTFRRSAFERSPYPEGHAAEDHWCWLSLPLEIPLANLADVLCYLRRHPSSVSSMSAVALETSSFGAVQAFLKREVDMELSLEDVKILWGKGNAESPQQVDRVSKALDALEGLFLKLVTGDVMFEGFQEDFLRSRQTALEDYVP